MLSDRQQMVSDMNQASALNSQVSTIPQFVWRIVDLIVGGIFIYAGAIKVLDPVQFATDIDNYKILPWPISVGLAFYLPWLEIFSGLALILRRLYLGGLSILTALVAVFLAATIAAKIRGLDITCGCFGHASQNWNFPAHLTVDLAILGALLALSFRVVSGNRRQDAVYSS
jgi:putative oxidoreductase